MGGLKWQCLEALLRVGPVPAPVDHDKSEAIRRELSYPHLRAHTRRFRALAQSKCTAQLLVCNVPRSWRWILVDLNRELIQDDVERPTRRQWQPRSLYSTTVAHF